MENDDATEGQGCRRHRRCARHRRAIAERYADEGARIVIADILAAEAQATAQHIGRGAIGLALDVTKQESIDAMVAATVQQAGRIDVLVNNAGVFDMAPLLDITRRQLRQDLRRQCRRGCCSPCRRWRGRW